MIKTAIFAFLAAPISFIKQLKEIRAGVLVLGLAFLSGLGVGSTISQLIGYGDRLDILEDVQDTHTIYLMDLRCQNMVQRELYNSFSDCWRSMVERSND